MSKMLAVVAAMLLSCTSAIAGMSHKVFQNPPAQVFAAAVSVAQHGVGTAVDAKAQTVSFSTGSSGAILGVNKLTVFVSGLPDGCGKEKPCTATNVQVQCIRVFNDTMGYRLCSGDVNKFFGRLRKELKKSPTPSANNSPPDKP